MDQYSDHRTFSRTTTVQLPLSRFSEDYEALSAIASVGNKESLHIFVSNH